jgi:hypothetical protein
MVRPPSSSWDKKVRYSAIGHAPGADHDDVFVVSTLFHHVSVLRVRVPHALLRALDGEEVKGGGGARDQQNKTAGRPWGKVEVFRSRWFDFFIPDDRVAAMKIVWAMMAYLMRKIEDADVKMADS